MDQKTKLIQKKRPRYQQALRCWNSLLRLPRNEQTKETKKPRTSWNTRCSIEEELASACLPLELGVPALGASLRIRGCIANRALKVLGFQPCMAEGVCGPTLPMHRFGFQPCCSSKDLAPGPRCGCRNVLASGGILYDLQPMAPALQGLLAETFLVKDKLAGAVREASALGYYSSFVPAKKAQGSGRPSGGLAILCQDGQPQQRFEKVNTGNWVDGLITCSDDPLASEKNRALCIEFLGSVSSLGPRQVLLGRHWNLEASEMPIDLIRGGQVVRPLSEEEATAPKGESVKLALFLTSKVLAPACGVEEAIDLKPDHVAVWLPLQLDRLSPGFRGPACVHERDTAELWQLWCSFDEEARTSCWQWRQLTFCLMMRL
eukprot:4445453-Amphidinium_carterae.2